MTAAGKPWHPDCFKCDDCDAKLKGGKYQADQYGVVRCMNCLNKAANNSNNIQLGTNSNKKAASISANNNKSPRPKSSTANPAASAKNPNPINNKAVPFGHLVNPNDINTSPMISKAATNAIVGNKHLLTGKMSSAGAGAKAKPKVKPNFAVASNAVGNLGLNYGDF